MKPGKRSWMVVIAGMMLLLGVPLQAAEFSPMLEAELSQAAARDYISAIVIFESPINIQTLDDKLHAERAPLAVRHREVIEALWYNAESVQPKFRAEFDAAIAAGDVTGYTPYWIENLFVVQATMEFIEALRPRGDIRYVTENFRAEMIEPIRTFEKAGYDPRNERNPLDTRFVPPGITAVGALRVNEELGITGQGVLVANLDTGVDGNHPALAARWRGLTEPWQECWRDALGTNTTFPNDGNGHGTHVMGTITGRAVSGSDTTWIGCAPAARWIANNAINQGVSGAFDNDIIDAYQWFADPDSNSGTLDDVPDVIQNSWGVFTGLGYAQCFTLWNTVILNCEAAGPVITWSAGNESTSGLRSPAIFSINATQIFSVGAVDATNYSAPYPLASFSSQGPTPCTPAIPDNIKPEIAAPGVSVYSSIPGGGYSGSYSGTSMAGPHVAGVVALMREACPDCDPTTIKEAIMTTAIDAGYGPPGQDNQFGAGFINAYAAVLSVSNLGRVGGVVRDASNNPLAGARVKNASGQQQALTDVNGQYYLPLPEGTYSIEYTKFGYLPQTVAGVTIVEGDTVIRNVTLQTAPQGTVSGIVTDCFGNPAAGATVEMLDVPVTPATANGSGFYSITLPQGTYDMRASGAGCGAQTVTGVVIGAATTQNFTLPWDPRFECSAADAGGYVACENGDLNGPTFSWFEISPNAGGPGTLSGITGDDTYSSFPLPFSFRLYGQNFTSVYVGSNGILTFNSGVTTFTNQALPTSTLGHAVVPFWDDLNPGSGGDISYYYHAAENAFIVEFRAVHHYPSGSPETFQVWLYNVATNPGPNGDSQIRIQYQTVASGGSCTIGTQNGTIANQYVYNGALDANAQGLQNGRVITYGGTTTPVFGTLQGTITSCQGGPAANATVSFPGSFYPDIQANASGFYTLDVVPGTYNVRAANATCTANQSNGHVVAEGGTTVVNLTLLAPGILEGTVTSCTGGPAAGATVTLLSTIYPPATTNAAGFYQFAALPAGSYDLEVDYGGCAPAQANNVVVTSGGTTTRNFTLISDPAFQCSPEDAYGYTACENVDAGGPAFNWRAIAPAEGGPGTLVTGLSDDSYAGPFTLPFPVQFYGAVYTQYYVNSNGYVTFNAGNTRYSNACLPQTTMPIGLYPFWDDLYPPATGCQIATHHNTTDHVFVVEYYRVGHCCSSTYPESFEIVIYDVAYYPTTTGDNDILFQYTNPMSLLTSNTVGIQASGTNYLQYVCNNVLPPSSAGIEVGRSILFSTGHCVGSPEVAVSVTGLQSTVPLGGSDTQTFTICNQGTCPLSWSVDFTQFTPAAVSSLRLPSVVSLSKDDELLAELEFHGNKRAAGPRGRSPLDSQGGPDAFGYRWIDSNEPGGPTFNWVDISGIGVNAGINSDDQTVGPFALPWTFDFYGQSKTTFYISSNGNIQFSSPSAAYFNTSIPSTSLPNDMIAPMWDDFNFFSAGAVYYYHDAANNRFIVQWHNSPRFDGTGSATFQLMLFPNGRILYQYLTLTGTTNDATVGVEDAAGTTALEVVYNAPYLADNLAIQIQAALPWLSFTGATSGSLDPPNCATVTVNFDAGELPAGTYTGQVVVSSNDPDENPTNLPVTFTVGSLTTPTNLTIYYLPATTQLQFRWQASGAPLYRVLSSTLPTGPFDTLVGQTATTSLTIPFPGTARLFYVVVATDGAALQSPPAGPAQLK